MRRPEPDALYSDFVSAIFIALLFTWVQTSAPMMRYFRSELVRLLPDAASVTQSNSQVAEPVHPSATKDKSAQPPSDILPFEMVLRCLFLLLALMCIWWWYQMHLAKYSPARTLPAYAIDFVTLLLFATAILYWSRGGRVFYFAIAIPTLAMIARFWSAYSCKHLPWIPPPRRFRVYLGLGALAVVLVLLLIAAWVELLPQYHNGALLMCMVIGIAVTFVSAGFTDGFGLTHTAPLTRPSDMLVFLPPLDVPPLTATSISEISSLDHLGLSKFEADLIKAPPAYRYVHLSNVHSLQDTRVHSLILALPSIANAEEIRRKCYLTYAAHWFDDLFDRGINSGHLRRSMISTKGSDDYQMLSRVDRRFDDMIRAVTDVAQHHDFVSQALDRLMLGALIFRDDKAASKATAIHLKLVRRRLTEDAEWDLKKDVAEFVGKQGNEPFIHLTAKTVQELWFGCESEKHPFGYTLLFSILYGPALYYHNDAQEVTCREMAEKMGISGPLPDLTAVSSMIKEVALLISRYTHDTRKPLRKIQIRTVANSFQLVMDDQIRKAYEDAAAML